MTVNTVGFVSNCYPGNTLWIHFGAIEFLQCVSTCERIHEELANGIVRCARFSVPARIERHWRIPERFRPVRFRFRMRDA